MELNKPFFGAEANHQDYLMLHPEGLYIAINDLPKVGNLRSLFPKHYHAEPVLVGTKNYDGATDRSEPCAAIPPS